MENFHKIFAALDRVHPPPPLHLLGVIKEFSKVTFDVVVKWILPKAPEEPLIHFSVQSSPESCPEEMNSKTAKDAQEMTSKVPNHVLHPTEDPELPSDLTFVDTGYGKNHVKLLHIRREGQTHHIKELEINTQLTLDSKKDYLYGDNGDIVATDSQKNTVYIMAKNHGIKSLEEFGLLLCSHFLSKYPHVNKVRVCIEEHPWDRLMSDGVPHNHAFISTPVALRFSTVTFRRGALPEIESGLKNLRVIKTTQSAFENFIHDEFSTLPDTPDRVFSTIVYSKWHYGLTNGVDFDLAWNTVRDCILDAFAGPPDTGVFSPSVQNTLYIAQKNVLERIPQMSKIEVLLPNKHYYPIDFSKFAKVGLRSNDDVFLPGDKPAGSISAVLGRKSLLNVSAKY